MTGSFGNNYFNKQTNPSFSMGKCSISFVEKFFANLGATIIPQDGVLIVTNVPRHFEKFYGKNAPYKFTQDKSLESEEIELLEKGSYTMKSIKSFLENSGQTTLLKIDFSIDPELEIKKRIDLKNSRLMKLSSKKRFNIFFRFTFHTSFQYLNEREKVINEIYVHDGKVINGNLDGYPVLEGNKREIMIPDMKEPYFVAKDELKILLKDKTDEVADSLNGRLDKEIERIQNHFFTEEGELNDNLNKAKDRLIELRGNYDLEKIDRQEKIVKNILDKLNPDERGRDRERSILIENTKHGLNVNNKLFNTTLIYHPKFTYDATIKNQNVKRVMEVSYDPLTESLNPISCESCQKETKEINLCSNGHVTCNVCFTECESCGKGHCNNCVLNMCELCNARICKDCKTRCFKCGKLMCKSHTQFDKLTNRHYCNNCLTRCERCGTLKIGDDFKNSPRTGVKICEMCFRDEMQKKVLEGVF